MRQRRLATGGVLSLFVVTSAWAIDQQSADPAVAKVDAAMRFTVWTDPNGTEYQCQRFLESPDGCLLVMVSGVHPYRLGELFSDSAKAGGIYVVAGDQKYPAGRVIMRADSGYTLIEFGVPKAPTKLALVVGRQAPVPFEVAPQVGLQRVVEQAGRLVLSKR